MLIVGEKEARKAKYLYACKGEGDKGSVKIATFAEQIAEEVTVSSTPGRPKLRSPSLAKHTINTY